MHIIVQSGEAAHEVKRSRFLSSAHACAAQEEIASTLARLRSEHPKANHHVWAWRMLEPTGRGIAERCDDDGEPGGTAGRPTLQALQGRAVVNALVVTVRYFGGIKLGAGGLVRAYGTAAHAALTAARLAEHVPTARIRVRAPFALAGTVEALCARAGATVLGRRFDPDPELLCEVPRVKMEALLRDLREASGGRVAAEEDES